MFDNYSRVLSIASVVMLFLAIPPIWPYGYFQLLRWVVTATAVYNGYLAHKADSRAWTLAMGVIAILFNPIAPIFLAKGVWVFLDIGVAVVFLIFVNRRQ